MTFLNFDFGRSWNQWLPLVSSIDFTLKLEQSLCLGKGMNPVNLIVARFAPKVQIPI